MKRLLPVVFWVALIGVVFQILDNFTPHDDTDPQNGRSGMSLFVDYGTGCEYLGLFWPTVPRMASDGKQVCHGKKP